jgi:fatty-acyl-CoA synthase
MHVGDWVRKWSQIKPGKRAIIEDGREFSYQRLNERCNQVGNFLLEKGVAKGDRIAILAYNSHEFVEIYLAAAKTGAIFVPLNWRMARDEILEILNDCSPRFFFFFEDFADDIRVIKDSTETIKFFITIGTEEASWFLPYGRLKDYSSREPIPPKSIQFNDPHILLYTSGTTGTPKGAVLSNSKTFFNALNANIFFNLIHNDIFLVSRPLFHSGGLLIDVTPTLYKGGTIILKRRFSTQEFLETIEKYRITIAEPPATFLNFILNDCDLQQYDLKSLKCIYTGGERVQPTLLSEYHKRHIPLSQIFGMTETSILTWLPIEYAFEKAGSVGKPVFHCDLKIVNRDGSETGPGETGEIAVTGPILMSGYWNRPEQTAEVMRDGWFYTGDLAMTDDDGFIYIVDRIKDIYISGGENIHPTEIEKHLLKNPSIFDVAVYGVPHRKWGEVGKASVVLKDGVKITAEEVVAFLQGKIGKFKIPRYIEFVDDLPRTPTGKIMRYILAKRFRTTEKEIKV